jgi:hypothetical protein
MESSVINEDHVLAIDPEPHLRSLSLSPKPTPATKENSGILWGIWNKLSSKDKNTPSNPASLVYVTESEFGACAAAALMQPGYDVMMAVLQPFCVSFAYSEEGRVATLFFS